MTSRPRRWSAPDHLLNDPHLAVLCPPPLSAPADVRAEFALHYAMLAPSVHNSQPWRIRFTQNTGEGTSFEIYEDLARSLPALDPEHRQLILSCGAAIGALRCGLSHLGLRADVELFPDARYPRLLARINSTEAADEQEVTNSYGQLASFLPGRRTYRGPFSSEDLLPEDIVALSAAAAQEGARLVWVLERVRTRRIAQIVAQADRAQDSLVHGEVQLWTRRDQRARDGIPPENWQLSSSAAARDPLSQRDFSQGRRLPVPSDGSAMPEVAPGDCAIPAIAVVSTEGDRPTDWLQAGQALMHVLLSAEARGLAVGYLNQPLESPTFRLELIEALRPSLDAGTRIPQVAIKLGHPRAAMAPTSPRRSVVSVLERP